MIGAKFLSDAAWCFYMFWLPKYLLDARGFNIKAVGTFAGFVGLGGALGGVVLGQLAGYLLDPGFSYTPVLVIAGSLHVAAFLLILVTVRSLQPLPVPAPASS